MYPLDKYTYYVDEKNEKVIAISSYAGKLVKGVAKCSDVDTFNLEKGKALAAARCNEKIARKRMKKANEEYDALQELYCEVSDALDQLDEKCWWAEDLLDEAEEEVARLIEEY